MSEEKQRKRKVVRDKESEGFRAAVRPHKLDGSAHQSSATGSSQAGVSGIVESYASHLPEDAWYETYWGKTLSKKLDAARKHFRIPSDEKVSLILDTTILGSCKVGLALCDTGIFFNDERGKRESLTWKQVKPLEIAFDGSALTIGEYRFLSQDGEELSGLIKELVQKCA